jgi:hypothetical protein
MSDKQTFYKDKPYVFVPLHKRKDLKPDRDRQNALADNQLYSGVLNVTLTAQTPIYFGQGQIESAQIAGQKSGNPYTVNYKLARITDENGKEIIALPGSGFKGMLRAFFETVTDSCVLLSPYNASFAMPSAVSTCRKNNPICPACSVFGYLGGKGRLTISSFTVDEKAKHNFYSIPQLQTPFRDYGTRRAGNERLYYGDFLGKHGSEIGNMTKQDFFDKKGREPSAYPLFYGRKFYQHGEKVISNKDKSVKWVQYECLEKGTALNGNLSFKELTKAELSALLFALGLGWEKPIAHKIGYAKPAFFGSVIATVKGSIPERYRQIEQNLFTAYHNFEAIASDLSGFVLDYYKHHPQSDDVKQSIVQLERIWSIDNLENESKWLGMDGGY